MNRTEAIRATLILLITQGLNLLTLLGWVTLNEEQLKQINLFVGTLTVFVFLFWKNTEPRTSDPPVGTVWTPPHG